jgi:erythromycin esterase-like protein
LTIQDLDILLDHIGNSQFVLLGEASHGTCEFYRWHTEITKRLIKEKEFSFIAVEVDWPDCYKVIDTLKDFPTLTNRNVISYFSKKIKSSFEQTVEDKIEEFYN